MKNKNRIQILQRMISKSDQIMDDIVKVTMQIYSTQPAQITMRINDQYPELSGYIEEMSVTIPDKKIPK